MNTLNNNSNKNNIKEVDVVNTLNNNSNKNNIKEVDVMTKNNKEGLTLSVQKLLEKEGIILMPGAFFVGAKNDKGFICGYICTDDGVVAKVKVKGKAIISSKKKEDKIVKYNWKEFKINLFNREVNASITLSTTKNYLTGVVKYINKKGDEDKVIFRWNRRKYSVPQVLLNGKRIPAGGKARALQALVITLINEYRKEVMNNKQKVKEDLEQKVLNEAAATKLNNEAKDKTQDKENNKDSNIPKFDAGNPASEKEMFK